MFRTSPVHLQDRLFISLLSLHITYKILMYSKERISLDVTNVCEPKAIISSTFFRNVIFTPYI
jgi:hypothetical protein